MQMKALVIHGPSDMRLEDVQIPVVGPDEVLVRVGATGICTTDIELYDGSMPYIRQGVTSLPLTPGHEWAGRVAEVGSGVEGIPIGSRVVGDVSIGCGKCYYCMQGKYHICDNRREVGVIHYNGAFAEYVKIPAKNVYLIPDSISLEEAAFIEPAATSVNGVMRTGVEFGDRVVVFGDGAIGLLAAQAAACQGASKVIVVARKWDNKKMIEGWGLTLINNKEQNLEQEVSRVFGGKADVVFEATGNADVLNEAIKILVPGGKICDLSITGKESISVDVDYLVTRDITFIGVVASPNAFVPTIRMMAEGKINVKPMITKCYSLEEGVEAFKYVKERKGPRIKVMVVQNI